MGLGDVTHDREPQTGATRVTTAGLVDAIEALEDALEVATGNTDPVVTDHDDDIVAVPFGLDRNHLAGLRVLHCVVEQVDDRADDLPAIAVDTRAAAVVVHLQ